MRWRFLLNSFTYVSAVGCFFEPQALALAGPALLDLAPTDLRDSEPVDEGGRVLIHPVEDALGRTPPIPWKSMADVVRGRDSWPVPSWDMVPGARAMLPAREADEGMFPGPDGGKDIVGMPSHSPTSDQTKNET
jgi:hypothetical protein